MADDLCYVCFEHCNKLSACACKKRYIHDDCLVALVQTREFSILCPVCKQPFQNVSIENVVSKTFLGKDVKLVLFVACFGLLESSFAVYFGILFLNDPRNFHLGGLIMTTVGLVLALVTIARFGWLFRQDRIVLFHTKTHQATVRVNTTEDLHV